MENIVGKGENAGYQHFLLFPLCFLMLSVSGSLKLGDCVVKSLRYTEASVIYSAAEHYNDHSDMQQTEYPLP